MDDFRSDHLIVDTKCGFLSSSNKISLQCHRASLATISTIAAEYGWNRFLTHFGVFGAGVCPKCCLAATILSLGCETGGYF
jgi:hypothetical protein